MPVLITGASGRVGRALALRLLDEAAQVRAYVRRPDPDLKAAGAFIAVGDVCDVPRLEAALTGVHTLVHLVGGAKAPRGTTLDALNRESAECAAIAAEAAEIERFVLLSCAGASAASRDRHLRAKAAAEEHVRKARIPQHVIVRAPQIRSQQDLTRVVDALVHADSRDDTVASTIDL